MKNKNFSYGNIKWAASHYWFAFGTEDAIYGWDCISGQEPKIMKLTSVNQMRDWAGY